MNFITWLTDSNLQDELVFDEQEQGREEEEGGNQETVHEGNLNFIQSVKEPNCFFLDFSVSQG